MSLSPEAFWLYAAALTGVVVVLGLRERKAPPAPEKKPPEETRWRRFVFDAKALAGGAAGAVVFTEKPEGRKLALHSGSSSDLPLAIGGDAKEPLVRLERRPFRWRPIPILRFRGRPWVIVTPRPGANFPVLTLVKGAARSDVPPLADVSLQGSLAKREYEIRIRGKLAASVTRRVADDEAEDAAKYYVEVVKSIDPEPLLALAIALEFAAVKQGKPS